MNGFGRVTKPLSWLMTLLLIVSAAGCGGGDNGRDPILGGGGNASLVPSVTVVAPLPGAIDVPVNTKIITATFTKDMDPATLTPASFFLACPVGTPVTGTVSYLAAGKVATLTLPAATDLPGSTLCTATVTTGVKDTDGISLGSNFVWAFTTSLAVDTIAPTVTDTINANGATNVAINAGVGATFSEDMDPVSINNLTFLLKETVSGAAVPGVVSYSGVNVVYKPSSNLSSGTSYTVTVKGGASGVKDLAGNPMTSDFTISWTTGVAADTTAPTVTHTINANGATNVAINTKVGATFSEGMDPLSVINLTFSVKETVSGAAVAGVVSYSGVSALFIPLNNLASNTGYTVTVKGGGGGVQDLAGNPMTSDFVISWTTSSTLDTTPPVVTGTINTNGATNVAINTKVGATFSEGMNPLSITNLNFSLKDSGTGVVVPGTVSYSGVNAVFIPLNNLTNSTRYTVTIKGGGSGVKDLAGNPMTSDFVINWTTGGTGGTGVVLDTTPPTVTGTINANGATNVAINTKVGATFSEGMDPLSITNLNFSLKISGTGVVVPGTVSYSGVSAVFIPLGNLASNTSYTVTVKGGASGVKDLAGNPMASDFIISWTTSAALDTTPPTVTDTINANGATNVAINTKVGATFSEAMDILSVTNLNFSLKESVSGNAVAGTLYYSGVSAVFIPLNNLSSNTGYTVTVKGGSSGVKDLAGNPMTSDYVWSWTTGVAPDTTAPTVTGTINANGAINVAVNTKVGATFSEGMDILSITNLNFLLKETVSGNAVAGTLYYSGVNAVFLPSSNLAYNTGYTVTVKGGVGGVKDLAGNSMVSDYVWSWTTGGVPDLIVPTVTLVNPADLAQNVPITSSVSATFSEAMDPLTISTATFGVAGVTGVVTYDAIGKIATFKPAQLLDNSRTYTATVKTGAKDLAGNALAIDKVWTFRTQDLQATPPEQLASAVNLRSASTFGNYGGSAGMTSTGIQTVVNGNIGTIATGTSSITGFHDTSGDIFTETPANIGFVNGTIYTCTNSITGPTSGGPNAAVCATATQARLDAQTAYQAMVAMPAGANPGGNLANLTLAPGVYTAPAGSFMIQGGDLTLDAQGNANAFWVFQMSTTLTVGGPGAAFPQSIILTNGAQAKNVFWQVGTFATINAAGGGTMKGTIISQAGAAFSTAGNTTKVTLDGRVLSLGAAVTLVDTVINVPAP